MSLGRGLESLIPPQSSGRDSSSPKSDSAEPKPSEAANNTGEAKPRLEEKPSNQHIAERENAKPPTIFHIEIEKIKPNPHQPRKVFDEDGIKELAASIREFGLLQPVVVTKAEIEVPTGTEVEYYLISGERRLMAMKSLGMPRIPAIVRSVSLERERLELAVIENIQRENLNPIELARAYSRLQDEFRMTQREIAARLGKSREAVANTARLLDLPSYIQDAVSRNLISESHGRLLLAVAEPAAQEKLFRDLVERRFTTRELKARVDTSLQKSQAGSSNQDLPPEIKMFKERLSSELGTPVNIQFNGDSGKITIAYYSEEELKNIMNRLSKEEQ